MGVHHVLARRPGEDGEAPVLRRHQRQRVVLVVNELSGRKVTRSAQPRRLDDRGGVPHHRLGHRHPLHPRAPAPHDLHPEGQELVALVDDGRAVHRGQAGDAVDRASESFAPGGEGALVDGGRQHLRQVGEGGDGVGDGARGRCVPPLAVAGDHQERAAPPVRPHGDGQLREDVGGPRGRRRRLEAEQRREQRGAVGKGGPRLVHHLDALPLQHGDGAVLVVLVAAPVLHHQQAGIHHFQDEADGGDAARGPPHSQRVAVRPDAQVRAGALHGRGEPRQVARVEGERALEHHGVPRRLGRQEGERDLGGVPLLAPQAGPEGGVDDRLHRALVRLRREVGHSHGPRVRPMGLQLLHHRRRHDAGRGVPRLPLRLVRHSRSARVGSRLLPRKDAGNGARMPGGGPV